MSSGPNRSRDGGEKMNKWARYYTMLVECAGEPPAWAGYYNDRWYNAWYDGYEANLLLSEGVW